MKKILTALLCAALVFGSSGVPVFAAETTQEVTAEASEAATPSISFTLEYTTHTYTGEELKPTVSGVSYKPASGSSVNLVEGAANGYTVAYDNNINVGTAKVTVTGTGSYADTSAEKTFTITAATPQINLSSSSVSKVYDGQPLSNDLLSYTVSGIDQSKLGDAKITWKNGSKVLSSDALPSDVGRYTATISYDATYADADKKVMNTKAASASVSVEITAKSVKDISASDIYLDNTAADTTVEKDYSGSSIKPTVTINGLTQQDDGEHKANYDYSVSYRNNTDIGTAYVDITGHGNYKDTKTVSFKIRSTDGTKPSAESFDVKLDKESYDYTGSEIRPKVTVAYKGTKLTLNKDYTLSYSNNINPGDADSEDAPTVTVTGKGIYTNSKDVTFTINKVDLESVTISSIADQTYTGKSIVPEVTVKKGSRTLKKGTDYTVATNPAEATNVGTYKVVVTAKTGSTSFTGSREATFKIAAKSISDADVTLGKDQWDYTGENITPTPAVTIRLNRDDPQHTLSAGTDYTVTYTNNVKVGTGIVTITGIGNYTGTVKKTFTIGTVSNDSVAGAVFRAISDQTYTGSEIRPSVSVTLNGKSLSSSNYTVSYMNNTNAGTATVVIKGKGSYGGSAQTTFKIKPREISSVSVTGLTAQKYTGYAVQPTLTLTYNGKTLRKGTDYTLTFTNNANIGNGNAIINGLGNFTGTVTKTFPIREMKDGEEVKTYATAISVPETLDATAGNNVTITPSVTAPEDANTYKVRWSTSNPAFVFVDGNNTNTAETTDGTPAVVKAASEGSTVIKAELISDDGNVAGTYYTFIKATKSFTDVSTSTYYSTAVDALANYGYTTGSGVSREFHATPVVNGNTSTTYNPAGPVTRGQFVTMMYNKALADYKAGKSTTDPSKAAASGFSDVGSSAYYASAVNWASANGIAQGTSASTFNPNGTVTRAEAVTFLQRWLGGASSTSSQFSDVASSSYYAGAVGWAVKNGVTNGTSATTFEPGTKCNRGQAATFIYRAAF